MLNFTIEFTTLESFRGYTERHKVDLCAALRDKDQAHPLRLCVKLALRVNFSFSPCEIYKHKYSLRIRPAVLCTTTRIFFWVSFVNN